MEITPKIYTAKVMHKRLFPKENMFSYGVYYLVLPLSQLSELHENSLIAMERFSALSFYAKDHGACDGEDLEKWARNIIAPYGLNDVVTDIVLICMPRILGYVFNPISFWLCMDKEHQLRAVICEVNNTFGEGHNYLCMHEDLRPIAETDHLIAEKIFHVSPYLPREGSYQFRFSVKEKQLGFWIDYYDKNNEKQLVTSLLGSAVPLNKATLRRAFWHHPLVTIKTIILIHWQALRLTLKGIKYIVKPGQLAKRMTTTQQQ